jgi:hypothetical protein
MKNLCLLICLFVLLLPTDLKAQEKTQSIVTIELYSTRGGQGVPHYNTNQSFVIQTIDNQLKISENLFEPSRNNPLNPLLELRKAMGFWINLGYKVHTFDVRNENSSSWRIYFVLLVKDE